MMRFVLQVHQNLFLPRGGSELSAIVSVTALGGGEAAAAPEAAEVLLIDCSVSMVYPSSKMAAARVATCVAIDRLREGTWFAVVAGTRSARVVYPEPGPDHGPRLVQATGETREEAKRAVGRLKLGDGTAISNWLAMARQLFATRPEAIHHAILLTDGRNESEPPGRLYAELQRCVGAFQCDCRGIGTDWDRYELQGISDALLGTTDIIPSPADMPAEFEAIIDRAMGMQVREVVLHVLTPTGGGVTSLKQVAPEVMDLTGSVRLMQSVGPAGEWRPVTMPELGRPVVALYPTGAWSSGEQRDYQVALRVPPQDIGESNEVRAARVSLVADGVPIAQAPVRAVWTDDMERPARMDRWVAHYGSQAALAEAIEEGLAARRAGDLETATRRLGRAVQLAHASGNEGTKRLLDAVVAVEDAEMGTVHLRSSVDKIDEMMLDTRSRRTVRLSVPPEDA